MWRCRISTPKLLFGPNNASSPWNAFGCTKNTLTCYSPHTLTNIKLYSTTTPTPPQSRYSHKPNTEDTNKNANPHLKLPKLYKYGYSPRNSQLNNILGVKTQTKLSPPIGTLFSRHYYSTQHNNDTPRPNDNNNSNNNNNNNNDNNNNPKNTYSRIKVIWDWKSLLSRLKKILSVLKPRKPLTADHIIAIFSWAVFGTTFWIVVGTTTLISTLLWIINTLRFQEWIALRVGTYLTKQSGVHISFESAVGNWKQGTIRVQNVILAREGSTETGQSAIYLTIDKMDVKISLLWLLEGKGILKACKASGVRGFVDRRPEFQFNANNSGVAPVKRTWRRGDLEMESLSVSDLLIQLYLPDPTSSRPLPVSVYTLESERFRFHWTFLDLMSAKSVVGKFDGCLFTFGIPQKEDITNKIGHPSRERELKINGVPMSLLSKTATGPLNWIKEGTLDISLSITLPTRESSTHHNKDPVVGTTALPSHAHGNTNTSQQEMESLVETGEEMETQQQPIHDADNTAEMRFDVMFNHLHVSAPLYTPELSYLNNAVVHPILAYLNSHSKHIPLSFDVRLGITSLAGARSPAEAGLWDAVSISVAAEFSRIVHDSQSTETLRNVANTLLKDCWVWLSGWVYTPPFVPS